MAKRDQTAETILPKMHPELLEDLRRYMDRPISPKRWRWHKDEFITELYERADRNGSTPEEELLLAASAAVQIAQHAGRDAEPRSQAEWVASWYRPRVQNLVTADLLGPGWRELERHAAEDHPAEQSEQSETVRQVEARSDLDAVWGAVTDTEREFLELFLELIADGWDVKAARLEAGRRTGRNPNAVRQLMHRMKKRLPDEDPA